MAWEYWGWGEVIERHDFVSIERMEEEEEGVEKEGERINIQCYFYCTHQQEDNEF